MLACYNCLLYKPIFSTLVICYRPSVVRLPVCLSVVCLSVTLVRPTQVVEIFRNISTAFGTLAIL